MTKTWDTKNRIIDLLSQKKMTLTELSKKLGLAPSTINQHIRELLEADAIRQVDNPFVIKWKYYEVNPSFNGVTAAKTSQNNIISNPVFKTFSIILVVGVIAGLLFFMNQKNQEIGTNLGALPVGATLFSISDSPTISTVSAVNMTIDSAQVYSTTTGKWYTVLSTPKTFNLVDLRNISAALGIANLSAGNYDQILLEVSNVTATVNNQTTSVFLPSQSLRVVGEFNISSNTSSQSWVNIDVNLDKSLHFTNDGGLVMLPVINTRTSNGANLSIGSNGIITVRKMGQIRSEVEAAMNVNGSFVVNNVPVSSDAQLGIGQNGRVTVVSNPNITHTIVIHTAQRVIVITNVTNVTSVINNLSSEASAGSSGYGTGASVIACASSNGDDYCTSNTNISISPLPCPLLCRVEFLLPCSDVCPGTYLNLTSNTTTNYTTGIVVNATNPSNLPIALNASYASCQTTSQCELVQKSYCANGLPTQSACINPQYMQQYYAWYNSSMLNASASESVGAASVGSISLPYSGQVDPNIIMRVCPLYIVDIMKSCGCTQNVCTLYAGGPLPTP